MQAISGQLASIPCIAEALAGALSVPAGDNTMAF